MLESLKGEKLAIRQVLYQYLFSECDVSTTSDQFNIPYPTLSRYLSADDHPSLDVFLLKERHGTKRPRKQEEFQAAIRWICDKTGVTQSGRRVEHHRSDLALSVLYRKYTKRFKLVTQPQVCIEMFERAKNMVGVKKGRPSHDHFSCP